MKLYELANQYNELLSLMIDGEIDEEAIADTLEGLEGEIDEKIDNTCSMIKSLEAEAEAIKAEANKLAERAKKRASQADNLSRYLSSMLQNMGRKDFNNERHSVKFTHGEKTVVSDEAAVMEYISKHHPDLLFTKTETKMDTVGLKKLIKSGVNIPNAEVIKTTGIKVN